MYTIFTYLQYKIHTPIVYAMIPNVYSYLEYGNNVVLVILLWINVLSILKKEG